MQEKNMGHICPIGRSGVNTNNLFSPQQYGFRSNLSTEIATLNLMDRNIEKNESKLYPSQYIY